MKDKRITRLLRLLQMLQSGPGKNASVWPKRAASVGVRSFVILQTLREAGLPLEYDAKTERYSCRDELGIAASQTDRGRSAGSHRRWRPNSGGIEKLPFYDAAYNAAVKLEQTLPKPLRQGLRRECASHQDSVSRAQQACRQGQRLSAIGRRDRRAARRADHVRKPHRMGNDRNEFAALSAAVQSAQLVRAWPLFDARRSTHVQSGSHSSRSKRLAKRYTIPRSFDLDRHLGNAWHMIPDAGPDSHVVVRFTPLVAQNVAEVKWHKTQQTKFFPTALWNFMRRFRD